jgi:hypothetical protein
MGAAVRQSAVTNVLQDLLTFGAGLATAEHIVAAHEAGCTCAQLPELDHAPVLSIFRGGERLPIGHLREATLQTGDVIVYVTETGA